MIQVQHCSKEIICNNSHYLVGSTSGNNKVKIKQVEEENFEAYYTNQIEDLMKQLQIAKGEATKWKYEGEAHG
jgi:hypothetical protein